MNAICLVSDTWSGSFKLQGLTLPASLRSIIRTAAFSDELAGAMEHGGLDAQVDWADIRASLDGDGQAFGRLVQRYQKPIAGYLWRFTRQRQVWEELIWESLDDQQRERWDQMYTRLRETWIPPLPKPAAMSEIID
jgi:hypothetical protein